MTEIELKAWAETRGDFDDRHYCGKDLTVADVKAAVRQLFLDVAAECEALAMENHGLAARVSHHAERAVVAALAERDPREYPGVRLLIEDADPPPAPGTTIVIGCDVAYGDNPCSWYGPGETVPPPRGAP